MGSHVQIEIDIDACIIKISKKRKNKALFNYKYNLVVTIPSARY